MGTRINVMDFEIDLLTQETLLSLVQEYVSNDYLNVIHVVSTKLIDVADANTSLKESLYNADLVLPGEKELLLRHHVDVLETGGMIVSYKGIWKALFQMDMTEKTVYLVAKDISEVRAIYKLCKKFKNVPKFVGVHCISDGDNDDLLVNDINNYAPDFVLLSMDSPDQEFWIDENKVKINAKLCLAIGSVTDLIIRENKDVNPVIRFLRLDKIGHFLKDKVFFHKGRIFKRKLADYNNRKSE